MADQDDDLGAFLLDIKAAKKHFGHSIMPVATARRELAAGGCDVDDNGAELAAFAAQALVAELAFNSNTHARVRSSRTLGIPAPPAGTLSAHDLMQYLVHIGMTPANSSQWAVEAAAAEDEDTSLEHTSRSSDTPAAPKVKLAAAYKQQYPLRDPVAAHTQPAQLPPKASMPPPPVMPMYPPPQQQPYQPAPATSTFAPDAVDEPVDEFAPPANDFTDGDVPLEMPGGMQFSSDFFSKG